MADTPTFYPQLTELQADDLLAFNAPKTSQLVDETNTANGSHFYYGNGKLIAIVNNTGEVEVYTDLDNVDVPVPKQNPSKAQLKLLNHVLEDMQVSAERNAEALNGGNKGACVADGLGLQLVGYWLRGVMQYKWRCRSIKNIAEATIAICVEKGWVMRLHPEKDTNHDWVLTALGLYVLSVDMPMVGYFLPDIKPRQKMVSDSGRLYICTNIEFKDGRHTYHFKGMFGRIFSQHNLDGLQRWEDDGKM